MTDWDATIVLAYKWAEEFPSAWRSSALFHG